MELTPKPQIRSSDSPLRKQRSSGPSQSVPASSGRPEIRPGKSENDNYRGTRSGRAYVPLDGKVEAQSLPAAEKSASAQGKRARYWIVIVMAAGLAVGATYWSWHQFGGDKPQQLLVLTTADVNQELTQSARTALLQGQVPGYLSSASTEVLSKIKNSEMDLASKALIDANQSAGAMVHVYVSINGQAVSNDVLTPEHADNTVFPISRNSVTRLHYVVDYAGSAGTLTLSVASSSGTVVSTGPLATGAQADLQLIER
jgi:hypothetical protein